MREKIPQKIESPYLSVARRRLRRRRRPLTTKTETSEDGAVKSSFEKWKTVSSVSCSSDFLSSAVSYRATFSLFWRSIWIGRSLSGFGFSIWR
ncbi:unnamed protein product [Rhodiola kirilowii]